MIVKKLINVWYEDRHKKKPCDSGCKYNLRKSWKPVKEKIFPRNHRC